MIRKFKQVQQKFYRINQRIIAPQIRVLDAQGQQIGVLTINEALNLAHTQGLDLVEIAPMAKPPVAKIIDFKKFLYQQEKKKKEEKRKAKISQTKEVRLGPFMSENDLQVMIRRGREFLEDGDKLKLVVKFKGRQITRTEFGYKVVKKAIEELSNISKVDKEPRLEGRQIVAVLSAEKAAQAKRPGPPATPLSGGDRGGKKHEESQEKN